MPVFHVAVYWVPECCLGVHQLSLLTGSLVPLREEAGPFQGNGFSGHYQKHAEK